MAKRKPWQKIVWLNALVLGGFVLLLLLLIIGVNAREAPQPLEPELLARYLACKDTPVHELPLFKLMQQAPPPPEAATQVDESGVEVLVWPQNGSLSEQLNINVPPHHPRFLNWLEQTRPLLAQLPQALEQPCAAYDREGRWWFEKLLMAHAFLADKLPESPQAPGLYLVERYRLMRSALPRESMHEALDPLLTYAVAEEDANSLQATYEALAAVERPYAPLEDVLHEQWFAIDRQFVEMPQHYARSWVANFVYNRKLEQRREWVRESQAALLATARDVDESWLLLPEGMIAPLRQAYLDNLRYHAALIHYQLQIAAREQDAANRLTNRILARLPEETRALLARGILKVLDAAEAPPAIATMGGNLGIAQDEGGYHIAPYPRGADNHASELLLSTPVLEARLAQMQATNAGTITGAPAAGSVATQ